MKACSFATNNVPRTVIEKDLKMKKMSSINHVSSCNIYLKDTKLYLYFSYRLLWVSICNLNSSFHGFKSRFAQNCGRPNILSSGICVLIDYVFNRRGIKSFKTYDSLKTIFQSQLSKDLRCMCFIRVSEYLRSKVISICLIGSESCIREFCLFNMFSSYI